MTVATSGAATSGQRRAYMRIAPGRLKPLAGIAVAAVAAGAIYAPSAGARPASPVRPTQELVALLEPHKVFATLGAHASRTGALPATRPITGGQTVLPVVGHGTTASGARRLRVMLPGRPNGATGWIAQSATTRTSTGWRIVLRTSIRTVKVYRQGRLVRSFKAVVGKPSTPTPSGRFFVEESILMPPGSAGAPFALALSARSNVLQEFEGGPGQIAIHGVANLGGTPGTAVSHGCVRLADANIRWLAARVGPGVPVSITP